MISGAHVCFNINALPMAFPTSLLLILARPVSRVSHWAIMKEIYWNLSLWTLFSLYLFYTMNKNRATFCTIYTNATCHFWCLNSDREQDTKLNLRSKFQVVVSSMSSGIVILRSVDFPPSPDHYWRTVAITPVLEIQVYLSQVLHLFKTSFIDGSPSIFLSL